MRGYQLARRVARKLGIHRPIKPVQSLDPIEVRKASLEIQMCRKLGLRYRLEKCSDGLTHAIPEIMTDMEIHATLGRALGVNEQTLASDLADFGPLWTESFVPKLEEVSRAQGRPPPPQPRSYTSLAEQEAFALYALIKHKDVRNILDIGGMTGVSAWFFKECLRSLARSGQVHTIEVDRKGLSLLPDSESFTVDYSNDLISELRSGSMFKYPVVKHFGLSEQILPLLLPLVRFDLLYHDCGHTWQNTLFNVSECLRQCSEGTVHTCHDYRLAYRKDLDRCAERQVFNQFFGEGFCYFAVVELYGIGIAFREAW